MAKMIIKPHRWYLVDTVSQTEPRLIKKHFNKEEDVYRFIYDKLDNDLAWDAIKGEDAIRNNLRFKRSLNRLIKVPILKYQYPPELITKQDRKSFRTNQRYHERKS